LQDKFNLPLRQSTDSAEAEYFYEVITRANDRILITRPRIADNGSPWQPSPYWEEIIRCVDVTPEVLTSRSKPALASASSDHELLEIISAGPVEGKSWKWAEENLSGSIGRINHAQRLLASRSNKEKSPGDFYDGGLTILSDYFTNRFGEEQIWSASRLETYRACPFYFFVANILGLEKMEPPREGLDARQLGNIYHHILEDLYQGAGDKPNLQQLQRKLPEVAEKVFDQAPQREGFRVTAWWLHTQKEILTNLDRSLIVLETLDPDFTFFRAEQKFGIGKSSESALKAITRDGNYFLLRGFIDRVDKNPSGSIRIIDYKTSSSYGFTNQAVREGKKLQLPLYALAAEQALNLGIIQEGFYFHVRNAEPSGIKLSSFKMNAKSGPEAAMENAVEISWKSIKEIRSGKFDPEVPESGCPEYCPAAEFCWHYSPKLWV
jgi:RecB family exonuclease